MQPAPQAVMVDEMLDGIDEKLKEHGWQAFSSKKLWLGGKRMHSDFSIMKYVELMNMILVTEDEDNIDGCMENNIPYVRFGQNQSLDYLLAELEKLRS